MTFVGGKNEVNAHEAWPPDEGESPPPAEAPTTCPDPQPQTKVAAAGAEPDDDALMACSAAGDQAAFRALMARHFRRVYSLAFRMIPNPADAEDLAQDVFFTVWLKRTDWQPGEAAFSTWLYRVTINRCIDFKRKRKTVECDEVPEMADDRPDAAALLQQHQASQILRNATLKLSDEQQAALALFYHQGLSNAETAEILGTSVSAVESLLKRARNRLRIILRNRSKDLLGDSG
ncbi:MAG: sigma-70 family RNA polymerase sigma factor [Rhodospirillales bacterium]|nr:sigma-70 family RNA polymerase sigma factor [Rhodospirillales bacterium]